MITKHLENISSVHLRFKELHSSYHIQGCYVKTCINIPKIFSIYPLHPDEPIASSNHVEPRNTFIHTLSSGINQLFKNVYFITGCWLNNFHLQTKSFFGLHGVSHRTLYWGQGGRTINPSSNLLGSLLTVI